MVFGMMFSLTRASDILWSGDSREPGKPSTPAVTGKPLGYAGKFAVRFASRVCLTRYMEPSGVACEEKLRRAGVVGMKRDVKRGEVEQQGTPRLFAGQWNRFMRARVGNLLRLEPNQKPNQTMQTK